MSNKRPTSDDINPRPLQRQRGQPDLPTLLLQVWPQMVCDYRAQRDDARSQLRVLRQLLDQQLDELAENRETIGRMQGDIDNYVRLTTVLSDMLLRMAGQLRGDLRAEYLDQYSAAVADFQIEAIIDLTADEDLED